jgi:flagellar biosynthetic protein FliR
MLSLQMGLSLAPVLAPTPDLQTSGVGQVLGYLSLLIYVALGGHLILLRGVADSLQALPPGTAMDALSGAHLGTRLVGAVFSCGVRAAAPVMVALLLANVALAILSRAVPQLNAMMVSLPLTFGIGMMMIGVALPIIASVVGGWVQSLQEQVGAVVGAFQPAP